MRWQIVYCDDELKDKVQYKKSMHASILLCNIFILRLFLPSRTVKIEIMAVAHVPTMRDGRFRDNPTWMRTPDVDPFWSTVASWRRGCNGKP